MRRNQKPVSADFYQKVLAEAEKLDFQTALGTTGVDEEIALLRVKIKSQLAYEPDSLLQVLKATDILARLIKTRYSITHDQKKGLKEAIHNVLKDIAVPLGITLMNKKL